VGRRTDCGKARARRRRVGRFPQLIGVLADATPRPAPDHRIVFTLAATLSALALALGPPADRTAARHAVALQHNPVVALVLGVFGASFEASEQRTIALLPRRRGR
jgi:hypothetical protein